MNTPTLLFGHDQSVADWVAERIPNVSGGGFKDCTAIGVVGSGGKPLAGVVYHDYQPEFGTIQISMASDSPVWAQKGIIRALLHYPFIQLGAFKAWIAVALDNKHGLKTFQHIGFRREAVLAHQFGRRRHAVILRMLQPDYIKMYGAENG
jgi:RimJ/RimL family protein N-acetyltransferase